VTIPTRTLVIKLTAGTDQRPELCNQALTVAAMAVAAGAVVSLWLTGDASWLALPGRAEEVHLDHAAPLGELLATVLEGGTVTVCTQCALRRGITEGDLLPGARIAGSALFVEEVLTPDAQALVY
jgi:predicted peroxiredoxin